MKRDAIFGTIEQYRSTWERLKALDREIGEFERAHPGLKDYPRLTALQRRETLLHEELHEAATAFATTIPTTPAGVIAAVQFVCERYEAGDDLLNIFMAGTGAIRDIICKEVFFGSLRRAMDEWFITARAVA